MSKNIAASVHARLLNKAQADARTFNELLQLFVMERFLYRLSISRYAKSFVLKGGMLLTTLFENKSRTTLDIDLLGLTSNDELSILNNFREILSEDVVDDGLVFDSSDLHVERITEGNLYHGIRVLTNAKLGRAIIPFHIDIGFGDLIYPEFVSRELPVLLDFPSPTLNCYSFESVIAEKFESIVSLGFINSRMKDFYDIRELSKFFVFDSVILFNAIELTFTKRETVIPESLTFLDDNFIKEKERMWSQFYKRIHTKEIVSFEIIVNEIKQFLWPIIKSTKTKMTWTPPGPWK